MLKKRQQSTTPSVFILSPSITVFIFFSVIFNLSSPLHALDSDELINFTVKNESPQTCYKAGVSLFDAGRFWKAANIWEETLKTHSAKLTAAQRKALRMRIAGAYRELNNNPAAKTPHAIGVTSFDKACVNYQKAVEAQKAGNSKEAKSLYESTYFLLKGAEEAGYTGPHHDYIMAYACLQTSRLSTGWTYLDKAIKNNPQNPNPLNLKASYLRKKKKPQKQIAAVLERSLKLNKEQKNVNLTLCRIYASLHNYKRAVECAQTATHDDLAGARQLLKLFPPGEYREEMESFITNLAARDVIRKEKERLAREKAAREAERNARK